MYFVITAKCDRDQLIDMTIWLLQKDFIMQLIGQWQRPYNVYDLTTFLLI